MTDKIKLVINDPFMLKHVLGDIYYINGFVKYTKNTFVYQNSLDYESFLDLFDIKPVDRISVETKLADDGLVYEFSMNSKDPDDLIKFHRHLFELTKNCKEFLKGLLDKLKDEDCRIVKMPKNMVHLMFKHTNLDLLFEPQHNESGGNDEA